MIGDGAPIRGEAHPAGLVPVEGLEYARGAIGHGDQRELATHPPRVQENQNLFAVRGPLDSGHPSDFLIAVEYARPGPIHPDEAQVTQSILDEPGISDLLAVVRDGGIPGELPGV